MLFSFLYSIRFNDISGRPLTESRLGGRLLCVATRVSCVETPVSIYTTAWTFDAPTVALDIRVGAIMPAIASVIVAQIATPATGSSRGRVTVGVRNAFVLDALGTPLCVPSRHPSLVRSGYATELERIAP